MAIINTMEEIVQERIDEAIQGINCCNCEKCREDALCLALNSLPAKYVSTARGEVMSKLSQAMIKQHMVDIEISCVNAVKFVNDHPKHDK